MRQFGPWLWSAPVDLCVFGGSALLGLVIAGVAAHAGVTQLPEAGWVLLVMGVDVAHVHATWFRSYFDTAELKRRPLRYVLVPALAYVAAVSAYAGGAPLFWRLLAYVAVFHFVRQQVGWVALYRARAQDYSRLTRWLDNAAIYAATLYPLLYWHAHSREKSIHWFLAGDFFHLPVAPLLPAAELLWAASLAVFALRETSSFFRTRKLALGKLCVVVTTALGWYVGIVANDSDTIFTATNVLPHGIPYLWLLFAYSRRRALEHPRWRLRSWLKYGFGVFWAGLLLLAFLEELMWDKFVDHDRMWLFGSGVALGPELLRWLVPLLVLPQLTHYLLDGLIWRRRETRERTAQREALGFSDTSDQVVTDFALAHVSIGRGGSR